MHQVLKKVTTKGISKTKVKKFYNTKDGIIDYFHLKEYYNKNGDKHIYYKEQLVDILSLKLH